MIKSGSIIKHRRSMDVAFLVTRVREREGKTEVKGEWLNQGFVSSWTLGIPQTFKLTTEQIKEWQTCLNPTLACLRYATWK